MAEDFSTFPKGLDNGTAREKTQRRLLSDMISFFLIFLMFNYLS